VFVAPKCFAGSAPLAIAVLLALSVGGCSNFDTSGAWFAKPLNLFGAGSSGYTYAQLDYTKKDRPLAANDFVDANGACPAMPAPPAAQIASTSPDAAAGPADAASLLGGGVAIGMSECDVIARLGQVTAVNLSRSPGGDRIAVMTYKSGPRPGIYRFQGGRLVEMDRVELPPPPPPEPPKKKIAKKKPDKTKQPPKPDDNKS
jgi:hypothetical protein